MTEWDKVVLPTDKSGRFAIMSFQTYLEAGAVHTDGDIEVGEKELVIVYLMGVLS